MTAFRLSPDKVRTRMVEVFFVLIPVLVACGGYLSSVILHPAHEPEEIVGGP